MRRYIINVIAMFTILNTISRHGLNVFTIEYWVVTLGCITLMINSGIE